MTPAQFDRLRPGDVIRHKRTHRYRVVAGTPRWGRGGGPTCVKVHKVGHSWTDRSGNNATFIDWYELRRNYEPTSHRMTAKVAIAHVVHCWPCVRECGQGHPCRRPHDPKHRAYLAKYWPELYAAWRCCAGAGRPTTDDVR